jgi:hypothetical protein
MMRSRGRRVQSHARLTRTFGEEIAEMGFLRAGRLLPECILISALIVASPAAVGGTEINFVPQAETFAAAAEEYRAIWEEEGERIADALHEATGLRLEKGPIQTVVYEGASYSGDSETPMRLRGSYSMDTKRATLVHELSHRLIAGLVPEDFEEHPVIFLFVYDVWVELWGKEFADAQVAVESSRRGRYDYEVGWRDALALGASKRADQWSKFVADRQQR